MSDWIPEDRDPGMRTDALEQFCRLTELPPIDRITQRGRDPQTATFTFHMADDTSVRVGTIKTLWSQVEMAKVMAVTTGRALMPCKPAEWRVAIGALFMNAIDVDETPHETLADRLLDWLDQYVSGMSRNDPDGAAVLREPFTRDGDVYVHAENLSRWLKREYSEVVTASDLRTALTDLGFVAAKIQYNKTGAGKARERTTARYYKAPASILEATE